MSSMAEMVIEWKHLHFFGDWTGDPNWISGIASDISISVLLTTPW